MPSNITEVANLKTFQPKLCAFSVSETVLDLLPELQSCSESSTFMMFWIAECQSVMDESPTLDETVPRVWTTVKDRLLLFPPSTNLGGGVYYLAYIGQSVDHIVSAQ